MTIPDALRRNLLDVHGSAGAEWLARIPDLVSRCVAQWELSVGAPYADASFGYAIRVARPDGTPAVLKLSFPGAQAVREALALRAFGGRGCVALLAEDASIAAMLLQRAEPGSQLAELCETDDQRATSIAVDRISRRCAAGMDRVRWAPQFIPRVEAGSPVPP